MNLSLFITCCLLVSCSAWLPPERCAQKGRSKRDATSEVEASVVFNIDEVVANQSRNLQKDYEGYTLISEFLRPECSTKPEDCGDFSTDYQELSVYRPYNCSFHTYAPHLLSSVVCGSNTCKLVHTVSTTDTYTASEGYNWGVKATAKFTLIEKVFDVGGEVSTGGTYTCTYTKGKTTTDTVECSHGEKGVLQLYSVRSDMKCDFGITTMKMTGIVSITDVFSLTEVFDLIRSKSNEVSCCDTKNMWLDPNTVSDRLLKKLHDHVEGYNPYTDTIQFTNEAKTVTVRKYEVVENEKLSTKVVPFTNEHGDSVYQYACIFTH